MLKWLSGMLATVLSGWILHDRLHHRLRSWSWHFLNSYISQGSVITQLRCSEIISQDFVANLLMNLSVKEVWKSVNIWRSYGQYCSALFFLTHSVRTLRTPYTAFNIQCSKKQPLCFLVITSANINRFSKFFHCQIPKKTVWIAIIAVSTSP